MWYLSLFVPFLSPRSHPHTQDVGVLREPLLGDSDKPSPNPHAKLICPKGISLLSPLLPLLFFP